MAASRHDKKHRAKQGGAGASFSFKHADEGHDRRVDGYAEAVARLIDEATAEIVRAVERGEMVDPSKPFSFARYPRIQARMRDVLHRLSGAVTTAIGTASRREWLASCDKNDAFVASILDTSKLTADEVNRYTSRNLEALNAFQGRKVNGMGLSDRVWRYTEQYREQLEFAIDVGLGEGRSAAELSRDVRKNLLNPDALFRRVRDKRGMLHLSKAAQAFNPGQGVYRSAYKNAMRLTRSEINMAYRQSDWLRWQSLDFVVGYEVKRSQREINSNCPLCQRLVGKYPKWFKFVGWHPQCRCYVVPILQDWDSLIEQQAEHIRDAFNGTEARRYPAAKGVTEMPPGFLSWVEENRTRQAGWKQAPYFVRDNFKGGLLANGLKYERKEGSGQLYDPKIWEHTYTSNRGGYVVTSKERIKQGRKNSAERAVFEKELSMCKVAADHGHKIEYLSGVGRPAGKSYDVLFDGIPAELKSFQGAGAIVKQLSHAFKKQGAETIIVRLEIDDDRLMEKLLEARRKFKGRILYYKEKDKRLHELL